MDTILVPLDGSELSARALPYAGYLGGLLSAEVRLLHVVRAVEEQDFIPGHERRRPAEPSAWTLQVRAHAAAYLEEQAEPLRAEALAVETEVMLGQPHQAIVEAAERRDATLIVMATHGRGSVGRWLVGSVAHKVLRLTRRPLLAVRGPAPRAPELRRILVPLDGSGLAREAIPMALNLAERSGATVVLLTVLPPRYGLDPAVLPPPTEDERRELRERLRAELDGLAAECPHVRVVTALREGFVGQTICHAAEAQLADLIVLTTHGYSGPRGLELGSVTDKVLHSCSAPALIVPNRAPEQQGL